MSNGATKFTFDTVFDDGLEPQAEAPRGRGRRSFSEADVEALRAEARAEGFKAGEIQALEALAAGARDAASAVIRAEAQWVAERERLREEAAQLAFAIARKLAHAALAQFPGAEVEAALREAMHQAIGEPRIVLKAAPEVAEAIAPRLADIAHEEGFDGRVQVTGDPALRFADCRVEWRGGGAERAEAAIEQTLKELIARHFEDAAGTTDEEGAPHGRQ